MNSTLSIETLDANNRSEMARIEALGRFAPFEQALGRWAKTVKNVEVGYRGGEHDFDNDVLTRDRMEQYISQASNALASKLREVLAPFDTRFEAATRGGVERHFNSGDPTPYPGYPGWWWTRAPLRIIRKGKG